MLTETEIIILPYAGKENKTLLHILIDEFKGGKWNKFKAAIAFVKQSGNYKELLDAMKDFVARGGSIEMTFGGDIFGFETGSEYEAIETLLKSINDSPNVKVYLYHERGRTFHPKMYLFSNEEERTALLFIGSSNWSKAGFTDNIEVNVKITLDLNKEKHRVSYDTLVEHFKTYWQENE